MRRAINEKAVMLINDTTYAFNLRGAVIEKLIDEDFEVVIVGQLLKYQDKLKAMGAKLIGVETGRHGTNPISDLQLMQTYRKILKAEKPDVVLHIISSRMCMVVWHVSS